jgi:hypothetical protein
MPWVPEDEPRVTTGESPDGADRRKNAGAASDLPDESEVTFLDDEPDPDEESADPGRRGGGGSR